MKVIASKIVGSKMFGLDNESSDTDVIRVYFNPEALISGDSKSTSTTHVVEGNLDVINVELSDFMRSIKKGDLKYLEAVSAGFEVEPGFEHVFEAMEKYITQENFGRVYKREIERRYKKTWFKELNPEGKNFNAEQGYDSKYAAHLFRVITGYKLYAYTGRITHDFTEYRDTYLNIKNGSIGKDEWFEMSTLFMKEVFPEIGGGEYPEVPFPWMVYYNLVK